MSHLERLAEDISNDGGKNLENELIAAILSVPPEWTSVMRRMVVDPSDLNLSALKVFKECVYQFA